MDLPPGNQTNPLIPETALQEFTNNGKYASAKQILSIMKPNPSPRPSDIRGLVIPLAHDSHLLSLSSLIFFTSFNDYLLEKGLFGCHHFNRFAGIP